MKYNILTFIGKIRPFYDYILSDSWKEWRQKEKRATEDEMVGWHHQFNGHELGQTPGDGERQRSLVYCSPWVTKSWTQFGDQTTKKINECTSGKLKWLDLFIVLHFFLISLCSFSCVIHLYHLIDEKWLLKITLARSWRLFLCGFNWHSKHQEEHITGCKKSHIFNLWSENIKWPIVQNAGWNKMVIRAKKEELCLFSTLWPLSHQII